MSGEYLIRIRNLRFRYPGTDRDVLSIPALDIRGEGLTAVTGPSGAGKSTLVELLAGTLHETYEGTVEVLGQDWNALNKDSDRQRLLRRIGLIPQDYRFIAGRQVKEALAQDLADAEVPEDQHSQRIDFALREVGLAHLADREVNRLSGGQRQRVAIARMLARDVDLVIADEPTANLDPDLVDSVMEMLRRLGERVPVVVVTHDSHVAAMCTRTVLLQPYVPYDATALTAHRAPAKSLRWPYLAAAGAALTLVVVAAAAELASRGPEVRQPRGHPSSKPGELSATIASCVAPGQKSGADQPIPQPSGSITLASPPPAGARLVAYSDGISTMLGPPGWHCTSSLAADGNDGVTAVPPGQTDGTATEFVMAGHEPSCAGCIADTVCNYFVKYPAYDCPLKPPGEVTTNLNEWEVATDDLPGVVFGEQSVPYHIKGVVVWLITSAAHEQCAMAQVSMCDYIDSQFAAAEKPVTKIHFYIPGDSPGARTTVGSCFSTSIAVRRDDAYRCSESNEIRDPCFVRSDVRTVLCPDNPNDPNTGTVIAVNKPLASPGAYPSNPWRMLLADGRQCYVITGAGIAGFPYGCGPTPPSLCQEPTAGRRTDFQTVCGVGEAHSVVNQTRLSVAEAWY